ncbi:MAG TPA: hypothetical protein VIJ27_10635, partial [Mucilaginibacter sp.]
MNIKRNIPLIAVGFVILAGAGLQGCSATSKSKTATSKSKMDETAKSDTTRSIAQYFAPATTSTKTPDS